LISSKHRNALTICCYSCSSVQIIGRRALLYCRLLTDGVVIILERSEHSLKHYINTPDMLRHPLRVVRSMFSKESGRKHCKISIKCAKSNLIMDLATWAKVIP